MSYCRFTEGDVYAYECDGGVQFYVSGGKRGLDRLCNTFNEAYQYARVLRDTHGLDVPSHAIEALKADALEEAARICGPDSAVVELGAENAKLFALLKHESEHTEKLRGLVRDMWEFGFGDNSGANNAWAWHERTDELEGRMRELGIEEADG